MPRKSPQELARYHAEQAAKHKLKARCAEDPAVALAVKLRDAIQAGGDTSKACLDLEKALDAFIAEPEA